MFVCGLLGTTKERKAHIGRGGVGGCWWLWQIPHHIRRDSIPHHLFGFGDKLQESSESGDYDDWHQTYYDTLLLRRLRCILCFTHLCWIIFKLFVAVSLQTRKIWIPSKTHKMKSSNIFFVQYDWESQLSRWGYPEFESWQLDFFWYSRNAFLVICSLTQRRSNTSGPAVYLHLKDKAESFDGHDVHILGRRHSCSNREAFPQAQSVLNLPCFPFIPFTSHVLQTGHT